MPCALLVENTLQRLVYVSKYLSALQAEELAADDTLDQDYCLFYTSLSSLSTCPLWSTLSTGCCMDYSKGMTPYTCFCKY